MPLGASADGWAGVVTEDPSAEGAASLETTWGMVPRIGGVPGVAGLRHARDQRQDDNRGLVETDDGYFGRLWVLVRPRSTRDGLG